MSPNRPEKVPRTTTTTGPTIVRAIVRAIVRDAQRTVPQRSSPMSRTRQGKGTRRRARGSTITHQLTGDRERMRSPTLDAAPTLGSLPGLDRGRGLDESELSKLG